MEIKGPGHKQCFVSKFLLVLFMNFAVPISFALAQSESADFITDSEYEIINMFIEDSRDNKLLIYHRTYFDKGWAEYFLQSNRELIYSSVGLPVRISDEELDAILTKSVLSTVRNEIYNLKPLAIDKAKLKKGVRLVKTFDRPSDLRDGVLRIAKPIIVNDIAIYHRIGYNEAPIHILRKHENGWEVVYTFYDWLILE